MIAIMIRFSVLSVLFFLGAASASGQAFDAGGNVTIGLNADGTVSVWGYGSFGQISQKPSGNGFIAVSAGRDHAAALRADGSLQTLYSWGHAEGKPEIPYPEAPAGNSYTAIASGAYHTLALRSDGTVAAWGGNGSHQSDVPVSLSGVTSISAGIYHSLALKGDGTIVAWGSNATGQSAVPQWDGSQTAKAIAAGGYHSLALLSDGSVKAWGDNVYSQSDVPSGLTGVAAIAAGEEHSLALKSDGTVTAWGRNTEGQVSGAAGLKDVIYVNAGFDHNYAITSDGKFETWGWNGVGQLNEPSGFALPTVAHWSTPESGDYLHSHRWGQQIPSTALSTAVFDQEGTYTVSFGNDAMAANLSISAGDVTFAQQGNAYQVSSALNVTGAETALRVDGPLSAESVDNAGLISIASGGVLTADTISNTGAIINDGEIKAAVTMASGGTLRGNGRVDGMLTVAGGAALAPGASVGLLQGTDATFGAGGIFDFEIKDATAPVGSLGWDTLQLSGVLNIAANPADKFIVNFSSLDTADAAGFASNFDPTQNYSWAFVTAAGGIEGFDADLFSINAADFQNSLDGGHFSIGHVGDSLTLQFSSSLSAVPEPSSLVVLGICGLGWAGYRVRNRNRMTRDACETAEDAPAVQA